MIICSKCGRDIDAIWQDNVGYDVPICEDCAGINEGHWEDDGDLFPALDEETGMTVKELSQKRLKAMCIEAIMWADTVGGDIAYDLLKAMNISSEELEALGFDKEDETDKELFSFIKGVL